jgi:hypothetical protein
LVALAAREQGMPIAAPRAAARTFGRLVGDEEIERVRLGLPEIGTCIPID